MEDLLTRFIRYTAINTQSDENSKTCPSTAGQLNLARVLTEELKAIGLQKVSLDENGYVMAELPANTETAAPVIGFIAHMDTAEDASGENVKAQIIPDYDGNLIPLKGKQDCVLNPAEFPELLHYKGQTLITTDGTTLLGADDKAGVACIISAMEFLLENPRIPHGDIRIAFTPDEEIGRGADRFDIARFGAEFAYTVDGGELGEMESENFNAGRADILIEGVNVHPGTAKNQMRNAILLGMELNSMLPEWERPEHTEGYEGFFHLLAMEGTVSACRMVYIIRDHDRTRFENKKAMIHDAVAFINKKYGRESVKLTLTDQYYNMKEIIDQFPQVIDLAVQAITSSEIQALRVPVRGGTDGARLSFMGLPCPNIFTGGHNYHGIYEYIPLESMLKARDVILKIISLAVEQATDQTA